MDYKIFFSRPVVDLGFRRNPEFKDNILYDLEPKDNIALWVTMNPPVVDPICGMAYAEGFTKRSYGGRDYFFCSDACAETFAKDPKKHKDDNHVKGRYNLAFYDTKTNRSVLNLPIIFKGKGEVKDAGHHEH